jgi:hypothetical protein
MRRRTEQARQPDAFRVRARLNTVGAQVTRVTFDAMMGAGLIEPSTLAADAGAEYPQMEHERAMLADSARRRAVELIAAIVCALSGAGEVVMIIASVTKMGQLTAVLGDGLPAGARFAISLGPVWLAVLLAAMVIGVFILFWSLARRYWIGLLFVPVFIYSAIGSIAIGWMGVAQIAAIVGMQ